jgi:thioredoxin reductase
MILLNLFKFILFAGALSITESRNSTYVRYLVVGAGPGGLQIGHYLSSASRDYLILDAAPAPASFFRAYPRFRQLISINKYEVGGVDSLAFSERHDWNSLLSDVSHASPRACCASTTDARLTVGSVLPSLRFSSYSTDYYPRAERLVDFLSAFANASAPSRGGAPLRVRYGANVTRVSLLTAGAEAVPVAAARAAARFHVTTSDGATLSCRYLIWAGGLQEEVPLPSQNGTRAVAAGLVATYAGASAEPEAYRGKRVLVLGHGNGAWEFAHHLLPRAAYVHVAGRSRVALALENHYPGSVRAVHATLLESYNLKSLDGITTAHFERLTFAPAPGGKGVAVGVAGGVGCPVDARGRPTSRCSFRRPYDAVVACLGWRFSGAPFAEDARPALARNGKHPALTPRYEAVNVPGLFFAGTLMHGVDHKKSSGGFIHGFRYSIRALHRYLEEDEADGGGAAAVQVGAEESAAPPRAPAHPRWPATRVRSLRQLVALLLRRLNGGAGLYQMFGHLADVFLFEEGVREVVHPEDLGLHAAMELPWEYYDAAAAAAAAAGSDPTGLSDDVAAAQAPPPAPRAPRALAAEAAVDAALCGELLEEVPVAGAGALARARAARNGASGPTQWLQATLEFGAGPPPGEKDPFALDRADVSLARPESSKFIHPVVRYFSSAARGCSGGGGAACAPIAELHIVEDFFAEWRLHTAHVLPLGRFLQAVGASRGAAGGAPPAAPWPPAPPPPPPFLWGVLQLLLAGCDAATSLYWRGAAFKSEGSEEGWWLKLSVAAQTSLSELRYLAVHGVDSLPGVPRSPAEEAHTAAVKERWARARAGGDGNASAGGADAVEPPRPPPPAAAPAHAAAAAAARAEEDAAYGDLTARQRALGVLAVDARSGRCRALAEKVGVGLDAVELRVFEQGEGTQGAATSVEARGPLPGRKAAAHVAAVLKKKSVR